MSKIKTERLTLRPFTMEDADVVSSIVSDIDVARQTATMPHPLSVASANEWIAAIVDGDDVVYGIELEGQLIGKIGFKPADTGAMEVSYWLDKDYWGQGFATEAGKAALPVIFDCTSIEYMIAGHAKDNPGSGRVIEKLGFKPVGDMMHYSLARDADVDCLLYHLHRADFTKKALKT